MKTFIAAVIALAFASPGAAQLYKWVDKDGKVHYSDAPPAKEESKRLSIPTNPAPEPPKSAVARDKELDKGRKAAQEASKKTEDTAKATAVKDENCSRAKSNYQIYANGGRILKINEKGEQVMLDDKELEAGREKSRREMDEACKPA